MRIAFVDLSGIDFDVLSPERVPLGGMQSGLSYLSRALARRGHAVTVFSSSSAEACLDGVTVRNASQDLTTEALDGIDVVVSISCDAAALRRVAGARPLVLFTGHNSKEPSMARLAEAGERDAWDHFVFKSNWQADTLRAAFALDPKRISIISNAVAPCFTAQPPRQSFFFHARRPPVLYFSSAPFRGLQVLADAFPLISKALPGTRAVVYGSMKPYRQRGDDRQFKALYDRCRSAGMDYVGGLSQPHLAQALREADVLAFPSTYPETSCITLMEAMVSEALIVSRPLGAIPETCAGFGLLMPGAPPGDPAILARQFADYLVKIVNLTYGDPRGVAQHLRAQRRYALANYDWVGKAAEWDALLARLAGGHGRAQSAIYNHVQTRRGRKIFFDPGDQRARRLLLSGGALNSETERLWKAALASVTWDVIIDVGANYGEMLLLDEIAACPEVLAVEPNPMVLPYLAKTLDGAANIRILACALSRSEGRQAFAVNRQWSGMSRLGDGGEQILVEVTTIDRMMRERLARRSGRLNLLLKIDVEGSEADVLAGAAESIRAADAFCALIEVGHLSDAQIAAIARDFTFEGLDLRNGTVRAVPDVRRLRDKQTEFWFQDVIIRRRSPPHR